VKTCQHYVEVLQIAVGQVYTALFINYVGLDSTEHPDAAYLIRKRCHVREVINMGTAWHLRAMICYGDHFEPSFTGGLSNFENSTVCMTAGNGMNVKVRH
jgi:hypothetical protein